jgi:hypothetical protein
MGSNAKKFEIKTSPKVNSPAIGAFSRSPQSNNSLYNKTAATLIKDIEKWEDYNITNSAINLMQMLSSNPNLTLNENPS